MDYFVLNGPVSALTLPGPDCSSSVPLHNTSEVLGTNNTMS